MGSSMFYIKKTNVLGEEICSMKNFHYQVFILFIPLQKHFCWLQT